MHEYTVSAQVETSEDTGFVTSQFGQALDGLDSDLYQVRSVSVWRHAPEVVPDNVEALAMEEEVVRLMAIGLAVDQGLTLLNMKDPQESIKTMAREKLEELRSAW